MGASLNAAHVYAEIILIQTCSPKGSSLTTLQSLSAFWRSEVFTVDDCQVY